MSRRGRILAWVKTDAQRLKDEAALAKVTARITAGTRPARAVNEQISALATKLSGVPRGFWKDYGYVDTRVITT